MLAEIFITKLEAAARGSKEPITSSNSPFVPFGGIGQCVFKDRSKRLEEPSAKEPAGTATVATDIAPFRR
jgi:hypothetical protein